MRRRVVGASYAGVKIRCGGRCVVAASGRMGAPPARRVRRDVAILGFRECAATSPREYVFPMRRGRAPAVSGVWTVKERASPARRVGRNGGITRLRYNLFCVRPLTKAAVGWFEWVGVAIRPPTGGQGVGIPRFRGAIFQGIRPMRRRLPGTGRRLAPVGGKYPRPATLGPNEHLVPIPQGIFSPIRDENSYTNWPYIR